MDASDRDSADDADRELDAPPANGPRGSAGDEVDEGPGCMPAIIAIAALMLVVFFIGCGISTWVLFQKRTELAVRTLRSDVIPEVQQSSLPPEKKAEIVRMLEEVVRDGERGQLENWQSSGIMQRLVRSPLLEWGHLEVVEARIEASPEFSEEERQLARRQLSRLRRAVELNEATAVDFHDVLMPVLSESEAGQRRHLQTEIDAEQLREVVHRAEMVADRGQVPDEDFQVELAEIIRREIQAGREEGGL